MFLLKSEYNTAMIKIVGKDLMRDGVKIGWIEGEHIFDENGHKQGYFESGAIYTYEGKRIAHIEGDFLFTIDGKKSHIDDLREHVSGGTISDLARGAILLLIGD